MIRGEDVELQTLSRRDDDPEMRGFALLLSCALVAACAGPDAAGSDQSTVVSSTPTTALPSAGPVTSTEPTVDHAQTPAAPAYDVFLAAVAEAVEGTWYAETPFDHPEVVVSTGLVMCEALDEGLSPDEVVLEYLSDLTSADPTTASEDQLVLAGALIGGAEAALCGRGE